MSSSVLDHKQQLLPSYNPLGGSSVPSFRHLLISRALARFSLPSRLSPRSFLFSSCLVPKAPAQSMMSVCVLNHCRHRSTGRCSCNRLQQFRNGQRALFIADECGVTVTSLSIFSSLRSRQGRDLAQRRQSVKLWFKLTTKDRLHWSIASNGSRFALVCLLLFIYSFLWRMLKVKSSPVLPTSSGAPNLGILHSNPEIFARLTLVEVPAVQLPISFLPSSFSSIKLIAFVFRLQLLVLQSMSSERVFVSSPDEIKKLQMAK